MYCKLREKERDGKLYSGDKIDEKTVSGSYFYEIQCTFEHCGATFSNSFAVVIIILTVGIYSDSFLQVTTCYQQCNLL